MFSLRKFALACVSMVLLSTHAAAPRAESATEALVSATVTRWVDGWNAHDVQALGELLTTDVDFVLVSGTLVRGRPDFIRIHAEQFAGRYRNSVFHKDGQADIAFIHPDVAIVHWRWSISGVNNTDGSPAQTYHGIFTWVVVGSDGTWAIRAAQNTIDR